MNEFKRTASFYYAICKSAESINNILCEKQLTISPDNSIKNNMSKYVPRQNEAKIDPAAGYPCSRIVCYASEISAIEYADQPIIHFFRAVTSVTTPDREKISSAIHS